MAARAPRLALGTVQFGLAYGVSGNAAPMGDVDAGKCWSPLAPQDRPARYRGRLWRHRTAAGAAGRRSAVRRGEQGPGSARRHEHGGGARVRSSTRSSVRTTGWAVCSSGHCSTTVRCWPGQTVPNCGRRRTKRAIGWESPAVFGLRSTGCRRYRARSGARDAATARQCLRSATRRRAAAAGSERGDDALGVPPGTAADAATEAAASVPAAAAAL